MNTKDKGDVSEAIILARLLQLGYSVSIPWGDNQKYDLIVDDGEGLRRVQCKTGTLKNGTVQAYLASVYKLDGATQRVKYTERDIDNYAIYCPQTDKVYFLDVSDVGGFVALRVQKVDSNCKNQSNVRWAVDYELT